MKKPKYRNSDPRLSVSKGKGFEKTCDDLLKLNKIIAIGIPSFIQRFINGKFYNFPIKGNCGIPDRFVFLKGGRLVLLEYKYGKGKLTGDQKQWKKIFEDLGFEYHVIRSTFDMLEFISIIREV